MKFRIPLPNFKLMIAVASVSATAWAYVVQEGDTLSTIAYKNISKKVYGDSGSLKKIIALNPQIKNPNFIRPGEEISIGEVAVPALAKSGDVNRSIAAEVEVKEPVEQCVSEVASEKNTLFRRVASILLAPYFSIISLDSKDNITHSESTVASKYSAGITASFVQNWSESFQSAMNFKVGKVDFEKPTSSNRTLSESDKLITGLGIETSHDLSEKINLKFNADYSKELSIRAASTQSDTVDAIYIPSFGTKLSYEIANLDPFLLGVSGIYKAKMPAKSEGYDVRFGNEFGASLYLKQLANKVDDSRIETELGFLQRLQNTSVASQQETNIILTLRYYFSVGRRQGERP